MLEPPKCATLPQVQEAAVNQPKSVLRGPTFPINTVFFPLRKVLSPESAW